MAKWTMVISPPIVAMWFRRSGAIAAVKAASNVPVALINIQRNDTKNPTKTKRPRSGPNWASFGTQARTRMLMPSASSRKLAGRLTNIRPPVAAPIAVPTVKGRIISRIT